MTQPPNDVAGAAAGHPRTLWDEGRHPGWQVVAATVLAVALLTALDIAAFSGPGRLFGIGFVLACVAAALLVRPRDFFAVGVLPPLLMVGLFLVLAFTMRDAVAEPTDGVVQAVVSGMFHHSLALGLGYGLCLAVLGLRLRHLGGGLVRHEAGDLRTGPGRPPRPARSPEHPETGPRRSSARRASRRPR